MADKNKKNVGNVKKAPVKSGNNKYDNKKNVKNEKKEKKDTSQSFGYQLIPYIVAVLALFLFVCFIANAICNPGNSLEGGSESEHTLGIVGFWICQVMFGLFGPAAYVIPIILACFTVFWKKNNDRGSVVFNAVISLLTSIVLSSLIHVFMHIGDGVDGMVSNVSELFSEGAASEGGGVLGGLLAFALCAIVNIGGTIFLLVALLIPMITFLVGTTPVAVASAIAARVKEANAKNAEIRAERKEEKALEEKERREEERAERAAMREEERARRAEEREEARREREEQRAAEKAEKQKAAERTEKADKFDDEDVRKDAPTSIRKNNDKRTAEPEETDDEIKLDMDDELADGARAVNGSREKNAKRVDHDDETIVAAVGSKVDANVDEASEESEEDKVSIKYSAFTVDEINRLDKIKSDAPKARNTVREADDADEDEIGARAVFINNDASVSEDTEGDGNEVVFSDPNDKKERARGHSKVDDLTSERFDENNFEVDTETGEVFIPLVQDKGAKSADEFRAANEQKEEYFIGDKPEPAPIPEYVYPPIDLLEEGPSHYSTAPDEIEKNKDLLRGVLADFKINVTDISCSCGPTITRYEVKPEAGTRVRQIANLVDDIAYGLAKSGIRIEAPIPGKAAVGIEVPNDKSVPVKLRSLIETPEFIGHKSKLAACLGADVSGKPVIFDLEKMPHLLVAGTTGSGKSVCINAILMSILYHAKPEEVQLLLIDPKKVEFKIYRDIPHLCCRIISDPKKAAGALNSAVNEMEKRFELIEEVGVRNIAGYNEATKNDPDKPYMPRLVIVIDEFADLMMTAKEEVETAVVRIAQKARAAGIHLIIGTQRPSVDVITGLIKANIPSRIAFTVASQTDSRTILDSQGAEKLVGKGDMLFAPVGASKPRRVQGSFVSEDEVIRVVNFLIRNNGTAMYDSQFMENIDIEAERCANSKKASESAAMLDDGNEDPKMGEAIALAIETGKISTSLMQRRLEIGYGRAAKIIDRMEQLGYVSAADGNKPRKILITMEEYLAQTGGEE